jgi:hypothetical protein
LFIFSPVNERDFLEQLFDDCGLLFSREGKVFPGKWQSDGYAQHDDQQDDRQ